MFQCCRLVALIERLGGQFEFCLCRVGQMTVNKLPDLPLWQCPLKLVDRLPVRERKDRWQ